MRRRHVLAALWASSIVSSPVACTARPPRESVAGNPTHDRVTLTYLGVAGWRLDASAKTLLVDPYFSRLDVEDGSQALVPDAAAIARHAPTRVDYILIGHSHYDHLLDAPTIAQTTGATLFGTASTIHVARSAGVPDTKLHVVSGGDAFVVPPFSVRALRGLHSLTGATSAPIPPDPKLPMAADAYTEGGTLQYFVQVDGRSVLFIGSANFVDEELEGLRPDVAIVAVYLREKIPDYSCRLMRALGRPPLVLTNHFDAHSRPLGDPQMEVGDEARASLGRFADEVHACAPATKVVVPSHFAAVAL